MKTPKRGRPRKVGGEARTENVNIRIRPSAKKVAIKNAKAAGKSLSDFIEEKCCQ